MSANIHPAAVVEPGAELGEDVVIGPFCHVGAEVRLHPGVRLHSHVVLAGHTEIGAETEIFPFASLGHRPQDLKYRGEPSRLIIGARNVIREHVTMNPGTEGGGMETRVGSGGLFMMGSHIAHDCVVGDGVIMANNATLAGHVTVGDRAVLGGLAAVHQHVRIGRQAMIGGLAGVEQDVIPFGLVMGERAHLAGLNLVGLERSGIDREEINRLRRFFRALFRGEGTFAHRLAGLRAEATTSPLVETLLDFIDAQGTRGLCLPARREGEAASGEGAA